MQPCKNLYGDKLIPTTGLHGSNTSAQRLDELDQACLDFVAAFAGENGCRCVDIGGGSGAQSERMARLGAEVLLIDLSDTAHAVEQLNESLGRQAIHFVREDVRTFSAWPPSIDCFYSQRMLGYMPYRDILRLLVLLKSKAAPGARFFLSTSGLDTEYGADYPDRGKPVESRFCSFSPPMAEKYGIHAPQCLFREGEFRAIAEAAGLTVERSWTSPFGNPKVIAKST